MLKIQGFLLLEILNWTKGYKWNFPFLEFFLSVYYSFKSVFDTSDKF